MWPPGAPLWPAANDASPRRKWILKFDAQSVGEAYELRIEDEALELLANSQVWKAKNRDQMKDKARHVSKHVFKVLFSRVSCLKFRVCFTVSGGFSPWCRHDPTTLWCGLG